MSEKQVDYDLSYKEEIKKGNLVFSNVNMNLIFFNRLNISKNLKILEVGCGTGFFCNYLFENGYKYIYGCDVAESAIKFAKHEYPSVEFNIIERDTLPYNDGEFDVVLSFDVIEHIPNIENHFKEIYRVLGSRGVYYFGTPQKTWDLLLNIRNKGHRKIHCSLQTQRSLCRMGTIWRGDVKFYSIPYHLSEKQKAKLKNIGLYKIRKFVEYILAKNIFGLSSSIYLYGKMSKSDGKVND